MRYSVFLAKCLPCNLCLSTLLFVATSSAFAATITVTNTADDGPGTLRAALTNAANGDTINATGVSGTILLTSGELVVNNHVAILGPGPASLTVDGNGSSRVFHISPNLVVTLSGLTITRGSANGFGGGIYHEALTDTAHLTVVNCVISGNSANWGGGIYNEGITAHPKLTLFNCIVSSNASTRGGGGINNDHGTMVVSNCTITSNLGQYGGGILTEGYAPFGGAVGATLSIIASTISGNSCLTNDGGGIYNDGSFDGISTVTVSNSTISGNLGREGGGIYNDGTFDGNAQVTLAGSTLSGNWANQGGGIYNSAEDGGGGATVTLLNCTVSSNSATNAGGGIYNDGTVPANAKVNIGGTILKAGASGANIFKNPGAGATVTSLGYNLSSDNGDGWLTNTTDQINIDPQLGPLQNNGGPTLTHALLGASAALDKGKNLSGSTTDQRGFPRIADQCPANAAGGDGSDIGAVEFSGAFAAGTITVDNLNDSGAGSLRDAIFLAGICPNTNIIVFAPGVSGTISLTSGELLITSPLSILGPGPGILAVNGNGANRVFQIAPSNHVTIAGLTITNGWAVDSLGGGIYNDRASLTVSNCTITGNSSSGNAGSGGGIANDGRNGSASLTVISSTLRGNQGPLGGAILNDCEGGGNATLTVIASTFSGNSAGDGGAIYNLAQVSGNGSVSVRACTFSGNSAAFGRGGAIFNDGQSCTAALVLINATTFSGNTANNGPTIHNESTFTSNAKVQLGDTLLNGSGVGGNIVNNQGDAGDIITHGYNLSSDNGGGFLTNTTDQINTNPQLGPLQNNGGPTFTHALLANSPAIDKGKRDAIPSLAVNTDQRGIARPVDLPGIANASGGDGSDVGAFEVQGTNTVTPVFLAAPKKLLNGTFQFSFTNTPGTSFTVLTSTNIALPLSSWIVLGAPTEISPGNFQYSDAQATNLPRGFYRVRSP